MPGENRLVHLDVRRARPDQGGSFLPQSVRELERKLLLVAVVLVERERCEGERPREDRFYGGPRIRPRALPFVRGGGRLSRDPPLDQRLSVLCARFDITRTASRL